MLEKQYHVGKVTDRLIHTQATCSYPLPTHSCLLVCLLASVLASVLTSNPLSNFYLHTYSPLLSTAGGAFCAGGGVPSRGGGGCRIHPQPTRHTHLNLFVTDRTGDKPTNQPNYLPAIFINTNLTSHKYILKG